MSLTLVTIDETNEEVFRAALGLQAREEPTAVAASTAANDSEIPSKPQPANASVDSNLLGVETYSDVLSRLQPSAPQSLVHARSYKLLEDTRKRAKKEAKYDAEAYRLSVRDAVKDKCDGMVPYWYQEDIAEAFHLGLDVAILAGTGFGKTLPFVIPLLADVTGTSQIIIVSPLCALQKNQVSTRAKP